jgi:tRNA (guanine-N7-)-methyltransferase
MGKTGPGAEAAKRDQDINFSSPTRTGKLNSEQPFRGRRKGRPLHKRKAALVTTLLPQLQISNAVITADVNPKDFFDRAYKNYFLEIGFGGGEHLAAQAAMHPETGLIGCEPFLNGVASLLQHIDTQQLSNIRILADDARPLLDHLAKASIAGGFVLFADPWPKKRHAERRFINPQNLARLAHVMQSGAELRLASDDPVLQQWVVEQLSVCPDFLAAPATDHGRHPVRPTGWPQTRYEAKAIRQGRRPIYWSFLRR